MKSIAIIFLIFLISLIRCSCGGNPSPVPLHPGSYFTFGNNYKNTQLSQGKAVVQTLDTTDASKVLASIESFNKKIPWQKSNDYTAVFAIGPFYLIKSEVFIKGTNKFKFSFQDGSTDILEIKITNLAFDSTFVSQVKFNDHILEGKPLSDPIFWATSVFILQ